MFDLPVFEIKSRWIGIVTARAHKVPELFTTGARLCVLGSHY